MGRIVFGIIATALLLSACPKSSEPLDAEELREFQTCSAAADCTLAKNGPSLCAGCPSGWRTDLVAINKTQAEDFYDRFENEETCPLIGCPDVNQPFTDAAFRANRFQIDCTGGLCGLTVHESVGNTCTSSTACPSGHDCRELTEPSGETFCFFTGN